jgi:hypothetical protein
MTKKLKSLIQNDQIFFSLLVIFVGIISFGLGRLTVSATDQDIKPKVTFSNTKVDDNTENTDQPAQNKALYIGSKTGTKYHLSTCPGAKQIKSDNQITFTSKEEAEAAGYKPAANCPELQ